MTSRFAAMKIHDTGRLGNQESTGDYRAIYMASRDQHYLIKIHDARRLDDQDFTED
jgi:hypothetical protein